MQELQKEMGRLQGDVKARKLFEDDEMEERNSPELNSEEEKTDDDEDDDKDGTSGSDNGQSKKEERRGAEDKRQDFTEVMDMFGEEDGSEYLEYLNDLQRLHAAAVVDGLQPGLSKTLSRKASIGSLTNLVKTMEEEGKTEIDFLKGKLRIRGQPQVVRCDEGVHGDDGS